MGRLQNDFKTRISLKAMAENYGELWADAYIEVAPLTVKALPALRKMNVSGDAKDLDDLEDKDVSQVITMVKTAFISGKIVYKGKLVDAEPDDIEDLPMEVMNDVITAATGKVDPKA